MQRRTEAMANPLHTTLFGLDIEGPTCTHQDTSDVDTLFRTSRDHCPHPCPLAVISRGTTPAHSRCSGVVCPTHAASIQWSLGKPRVVRLYFVRPPEPHSTGKPNAFRCSNKAHRVEFTAAASFNGFWA